MKTRILIIVILCSMLVSCRVERNLKIDTVTDFLSTLEEKYDNTIRIRAVHVDGFIFFKFYFTEDYLIENVECCFDEFKAFLIDSEVKMEIRNYYSDKRNNGKLSRTSPYLWIMFYVGNNNIEKYYYENELKYRVAADGFTRADYGQWVGPFYTNNY